MPGDVLPVWSDGTVAVLSTIGSGMVHAIPVSTALRAGPRRIVFALSRGAARSHACATIRASR